MGEWGSEWEFIGDSLIDLRSDKMDRLICGMFR